MTPQQWYVPRAASFVVREWDADGVLYDIASGDTHRLGALHLEMLALLQQQPGSLDDLLQSLAPDLADNLAPAAQRQLIADSLAELARPPPHRSPAMRPLRP